MNFICSFDGLAAVFNYRPIIILKVIHILLAHYKTSPASLKEEDEYTVNNNNVIITKASTMPNPITGKTSNPMRLHH